MLAYPVADTLGNDLGERCAGAHTKKQNKVLYVSTVTLIDQKESFSVKIGSRPCYRLWRRLLEKRQRTFR
jgi:hypothetical protein